MKKIDYIQALLFKQYSLVALLTIFDKWCFFRLEFNAHHAEVQTFLTRLVRQNYPIT